MDDKDIKLDLSGLDELLDKLAAKEKQTSFDFDDSFTSTGYAGTISTAASGNIWPYVVTSTGTGNISANLGLSFNDHWDYSHKQALSVRGDAEFEGDIKLKGKSLNETLDKIEQRLAILHPNKELEHKWEKLKELGDAYRALEKDIIEKEKIWETLKK